jgi:hypothetical protein
MQRYSLPVPAACNLFNHHYRKSSLLKTTRTKNWNGKIETLKPDYLKDVITQMELYGERVRFSYFGTGQRPHYQVINSFGKAMVFDSNNHLHQPQEEEFSGSNCTAEFSLEQIKAVVAGGIRAEAVKRVSRATGSSGARGMTAAARAKEQLDIEKYNYFKANRQSMPPTIGEHSDEITELMLKGIPAAEAFEQVIKRYY